MFVCVCVRVQGAPSDGFHSEVVLDQLQELKVLDTALMQSCGYPVRLNHDKFFVNYHVLLSPQATSECDTLAEKCEKILQEAAVKNYHVGTNSVWEDRVA